MRLISRRIASLGTALLLGTSAADAGYSETNLVSNIAGLAANTDVNLKNPWGVSFAPTGPFWVSNQGSATSTLYNSAGTPQSLIVGVGSSLVPGSGPTGQVFNNNSNNDFLVGAAKSSFLFDNQNGQIMAWSGGTTTAVVAATTAGASYEGLAIASVGGHNQLYAADVAGNKIDVFDSKFTNLNSTGFKDANLTNQGFSITNVQTIGSNIYVTYANASNGADPSKNGGAVAIYDLNGTLIRDFSNGASGRLQDPWGVVLAPASFGQYGGDLLVGNTDNGEINAYNPLDGSYLGNVATITGTIANPSSNGLWALTFGNGGSGGAANSLYAFAGINNQVDGLIVRIDAVPEPTSALMVAVGGVVAVGFARRGRKRA
jgi:uncharacterized protein (TIGR03118 family)